MARMSIVPSKSVPTLQSDPNFVIYPGHPDAPEPMPQESEMIFVASFILFGELYAIDDNNQIWRWDLDDERWHKVGTIDRG